MDEASRRLRDAAASAPRWHFGILSASPSGFIEGLGFRVFGFFHRDYLLSRPS